MSPMESRQNGFTLVELLIGVAIAGLLTSVALPSFERQIQQSRRADVLVASLAVQAAQERFRSQGPAYGSLPQIGLSSAAATPHYSLQITASDADGFELLAVAVGVQSRDIACRHMRLTAHAMNLTHASGPDASVGNPADANRRCWSL